MSIDTQAAMRLAVMLQKAAPKAMASISPPAWKTPGRSWAGTQPSMIWASSKGSRSSSTAAVNFTVTPTATRGAWGRR